MVAQNVRWKDLVSPRAMYEFTLADAWGALPTLLAMGGLFLLSCVIIFVVKKLIEWLLLCGQQRKKYVLINTQHDPKTDMVVKRIWRPFSRGSYGSIVHVCLESMFFIALVIAGFFACSVGGVNIWESPLALSAVTIVITYIFGSVLQSAGSGWGVFITNSFVYGEYWVMEGSNIEGFVGYMNPFHMELERIDQVTSCIKIHRVSMLTAFTANWTHDIHKEKHEKHPSKWEVPASNKDSIVPDPKPEPIKVSFSEFLSYVRNDKEHLL